MTQRMIEITSPLFVPETRLELLKDFPALFGNEAPVALEIGCGIGDFIVQLAHRQPRRNFLAIDIYNKGCFKTCRRLEAAGLTNVRVARIEARQLLAECLPLESLAAVYVNCPDPWPKKRHRRRRLVGEEFLRILPAFLAPRGDFFFTTDFDDYAREVADLLQRMTELWENRLEAPLTTDLADYPRSKYMNRFLAASQPIFHLHYLRRPDLRPLSTERWAPRPGFRVPLGLAGNV